MSYDIDQKISNNNRNEGIKVSSILYQKNPCLEITSAEVSYILNLEEVDALGRFLINGKKWIEDQEEIARKKRAEEMINKGKGGGE